MSLCTCYRIYRTQVAIVALAFALCGIVTSSVLGQAGPSNAGFLDPVSWSIGDPNTTTQAWDIFTTTAGAAPDHANVNGNGTSSLSASAPAIVAGSGNLYAGDFLEFDGITLASFSVNVPQGATPQTAKDVTAIVQIFSLGIVDEASVLMNGQAPEESVLRFDGIVDSPGGDASAQETWYLFKFEDLQQDLDLTFDAGHNHYSLAVRRAGSTWCSRTNFTRFVRGRSCWLSVTSLAVRSLQYRSHEVHPCVRTIPNSAKCAALR